MVQYVVKLYKQDEFNAMSYVQNQADVLQIQNMQSHLEIIILITNKHAQLRKHNLNAVSVI